MVTGSRDSKMRDAVIDYLGPEAGERRVIHNFSGVRPCEPSTVATCAMHHTLTEFLLYVGQCACMVAERDWSDGSSPGSKPGSGASAPAAVFDDKLSIVKEDMIDFRDLVDALHDDVPEMVGAGGRLNQRLREKGQVWARHVTEPWRVMVLSGLYIFITVVSGYPLFYLVFSAATLFDKMSTPLQFTSRVLDAVFFILLPKVCEVSATNS